MREKNPLTEYTVEGFQIFDTMIDQIREAIACRLHLVRIQVSVQAGERESKGRTMSASHGSLWPLPGQKAGLEALLPGTSLERQKYQHCHGR